MNVSTETAKRPATGSTRTAALRAAAMRRQRELRRRPRSERDMALDVAMLVLAAVAAVASAPAAEVQTDTVAMAVYSVLVLVTLRSLGLYRETFARHFLDNARSILGATALVAMAMTFMRVLVFDNQEAAEQAVRAWLFSTTYLVAARGGVHLFEMRLRRSGLGGEPTLIVGAGLVGRQFADRLLQRPEFGLNPVAFLDDDPLDVGDDDRDTIPVLRSDPGSGDRFGPGLEAAIREHGVTQVVVSFSTISHQAELDLVRRCQELGVTVSVLPRLFEGVTDEIGLERVGGIPVISMHPADPRGWQYALKYAMDRLLALLAIVILSPILALAALATLVSLGRPIIFKQRRVGIDSREFDLFKFRTMRPAGPGEASEADLDDRLALGLAPGGVEGADRRSRVGAFLRRSSIDELPQLFNVLRGDMSLVGPRPERPTYASLFDESIYRYADRHRVKSGITGWAQVHGLRGETSIADRVEWDNYYIENRSFWLDLKILALTLPALLRTHSG